MLKITLRTVGETQHVDLVDNAIRARENAATAAQDVQEADGAAALENVTVELAAELEDPKTGCWMCQTSGAQLRVCTICNMVRRDKKKE